MFLSNVDRDIIIISTCAKSRLGDISVIVRIPDIRIRMLKAGHFQLQFKIRPLIINFGEESKRRCTKSTEEDQEENDLHGPPDP